jgi:predicted lipoprotein with Yx(FWY)xxD motif
MPRAHHRRHPLRITRSAAALTAALAGGAVAFAALASASSFTLKVAKNVHVTNDPTKSFRLKAVNTHESVAVGPAGYAVYTFQGETPRHLICKSTGANGCLTFWPPVQVKSAKGISEQGGIKGKLGTIHRHGFGLQLTLKGQPLYYFSPDIMSRNKKQATGDELKTFGSIWHIVKADRPAQRGAATNQPMTPPTPTTTTTGPYKY